MYKATFAADVGVIFIIKSEGLNTSVILWQVCTTTILAFIDIQCPRFFFKDLYSGF